MDQLQKGSGESLYFKFRFQVSDSVRRRRIVGERLVTTGGAAYQMEIIIVLPCIMDVHREDAR